MREFRASVKALEKSAPNMLYDALIRIAIEARSAAQEHIRAHGHIVYSRLINSIYIKTKKPVKVPDNSSSYSWDEGSGNRDFGAALQDGEVAIGTNVIYADKIRKLDDYFEHAMNVAESVTNKYIKKAANDFSKK